MVATPGAVITVGEQIVGPKGTALSSFVAKWQRLLNPPAYTVANLPKSAKAGALAYATNCRVFNGAGTREGAGNGTGGLVTWNGSKWVVAGTNVQAAA